MWIQSAARGTSRAVMRLREPCFGPVLNLWLLIEANAA